MDPCEDRLGVVRDYHERTKHHPDRFAASLGYLDWGNQPDPFRRYDGAAQLALARPALRDAPRYDALFGHCPAANGLDAGLVGRLYYHSLALSAWKQAPGTSPWSLRINPSSGALHPTEGYLICGPVDGLSDDAGIYHYSPVGHALERRARLTAAEWRRLSTGLPEPCLLLGLTSIHWREAWKYGERAYRYCHHDVGHAIGAIAIAARTLGWQARQVPTITDAGLGQLLGIDGQSGTEAEHPDCLLALYPCQPGLPAALEPGGADWSARLPGPVFEGVTNRLSAEHQHWPVIDAVAVATRRDTLPTPGQVPAVPARPADLLPTRPAPAEQLIRQRRSAVAMDGVTGIDRPTFYQMMLRTLPGQFPFATLPGPPRVALALFVHRVDGLDPGLYLLARDRAQTASLRESLNPDFTWQRPPDCPQQLPLYRLITDDARRAARFICCDQQIAADSAFALGMLAGFDAALAAEGPSAYPRLFWETGLIGQVLYLEAEAAGLRATGIGCFFDDVMHTLLGIVGHNWQSLYHFTVGGPVEDTRLQTIAPYAHLPTAD